MRTGEYHIIGILREETILKTLPVAHNFSKNVGAISKF